MGRSCCVLGCSSGGDAPSHQIPKNPVLFNKWKSMIYSEKIQHLSDKQISKCTVCYRHFADDDYLVTFRVRKLKRGVAPSLNLPNMPATDRELKVIKPTVKQESKSKDIVTSIPVAAFEKENDETTIELPETTHIALLFEDLPETLDAYLSQKSDETEIETVILPYEFEKQSSEETQTITLPNECTEQADTTVETSQIKESRQIESESNQETRALKKKSTKRSKRRLTIFEQLTLLQCKKQAEQYAKTSTIQKLLSLLTPAERTSIQARIQKSKYLPKVYIKVYHDIAKRKALGHYEV